MQLTTTYKMQGDKDLQRKLNVLPGRVSRKVTRVAINAGARIVSRDAKRNARRGKTKLLSKSIGVKGKSSRNGYYARIGARRGFAVVDASGKKYDPVRVVHLVEKGTAPHQIPDHRRGLLAGKEKVINHPGAAAHPFIRPALDNNLGQVQQTIRGRLWDGINQEARSA